MLLSINLRKVIAHAILLVICGVFPVAASAATSENCDADLPSLVPQTADWRHIMEIRAHDGFYWKRGLINNPAAKMLIAEDAEYVISGVAAPYADVQVYIYTTESDAHGIPQKPDIGTCFTAGIADEFGFFRLKVNSEILWGGIGREFIIDAFYRQSNKTPPPNSESGMNYAVSTGIIPNVVQIFPDPKVIAITEAFGAGADPTQRQPWHYDSVSSGFTDADRNIDDECKLLCDKLPLTRGVELYPWKLKPSLLANNLDAAMGLPVAVGRLMHTYYAGIPGKSSLKKQEVEAISQKALAMELMKREFGIGPWVTEDAIKAFADRGGGARYVRDLLLGNGNRAELERLLKELVRIPAKVPLAEVFPANSSNEELWAKDFLDLIKFWTGNLAMNTCLMLNDQSEPDSFFEGFENGVIKNLVSTEYACHFVETHGKTPQLLLHSIESVSLEPEFENGVMTYADTTFSAGNMSFIFPQGEKKPLSYLYRFTLPFEGTFSGNACVSENELSDLISELTLRFELSDAEAGMIAKELRPLIRNGGGYVHFSFADPDAVAKRLNWLIDGKRAEIFRLFFHFSSRSCDNPIIQMPEFERLHDDIGFETGII